MGFKSGEFFGNSNTGTWLSFSHFLTALDLWTGSPSCMNTPKWHHVMIKNPKIVVPSHGNVLREKYKPPLPLSPLKSPHTMTLLGCFRVLMMYLESYLETPEGLPTILYPLRTSRDVRSSQNITFLRSAIVQCLYILQNNIVFFIMTLIIRGFLAAGDMTFSDHFADGAG